MSRFKILQGDSSRISTDTTAFHEGWCYFCANDGGLYFDTVVDGSNQRVRVTAPGSGGSTAVYATLLASGWTNSQQTIAVSGLTADTNGVVGVTQGITDEQLTACGNAGLYVCAQGSGTLTVACNGSTPSCDIPVVVVLFS